MVYYRNDFYSDLVFMALYYSISSVRNRNQGYSKDSIGYSIQSIALNTFITLFCKFMVNTDLPRYSNVFISNEPHSQLHVYFSSVYCNEIKRNYLFSSWQETLIGNENDLYAGNFALTTNPDYYFLFFLIVFSIFYYFYNLII